MSSAYSVINSVLGVQSSKGSLTMRPSALTTQQCNVITDIAGKVEGQVLYGMSLITADKIASQMTGEPIRTFDNAAATAISELADKITGNAMDLLSQAGFTSENTPATIIRGANVRISNLSIPALVIPVCLEHGEIELTLCLQEKG